jgi:chromosome segregation ATPase
MEMGQPLERLQVLEKKIAHIIDLLHAERERTIQLLEEKNELSARLEALEASLMNETKGVEELSRERAFTKQMVDELIQTIDQLVDSLPVAEGTAG